MKIPIDNFEKYIDEKILEKGLSYFEEGAVVLFREVIPGAYEARVKGREEYLVTFEIHDSAIDQCVCDCPYDLGPICKHMAAAIFYLKKDELEFVPNPPKPKKKRQKSVHQHIKEITKSLSKEELIDFVLSSCKKDKKYRTHFLGTFGHLMEGQTKEFYQKQIQSIFKSAYGRKGYIDWSAMKKVDKSLESFLQISTNYRSQNKLQNDFYIASAILEEVTINLQYVDDSGGYLGYFIDEALNMLDHITVENESPELHIELHKYCISSYENNLFKGWDWHLGMLKMAANMSENEKEADKVIRSLDTVKGDYSKERAQAFKLQLLRRFKGMDEAQVYVEQNLSNSEIRENEIRQAFKDENYNRVIELCEFGIENDKENKPRLVTKWINWLLFVAEAQDDKPKIIDHARFLLIDNFYSERDYYQILKNVIPKKEWNSFVEDLIKELNDSNNWSGRSLIRKIIIEEKWWDRLFDMLQKNPTLDNISDNEEYLSKDYSDELIQMYHEAIQIYLHQNVGRNYYSAACQYLRSMKNLGGTEIVKTLVAHFRATYPRRRALMEELDKV